MSRPCPDPLCPVPWYSSDCPICDGTGHTSEKRAAAWIAEQIRTEEAEK